MQHCPHCGGAIDPGAPKPLQHEVFDDDKRCIRLAGETRRLTSMQWRILRLLRERFGRQVGLDFLVQASARRPEDGGSAGSLKVQLVYLRRKLAGTPFAIASFYGDGYGLFWENEVEVRVAGRRVIYTRIGSRPILRHTWPLAI